MELKIPVDFEGDVHQTVEIRSLKLKREIQAQDKDLEIKSFEAKDKNEMSWETVEPKD